MKINIFIPESEHNTAIIKDQSLKLYTKNKITLSRGEKIKLNWNIKLELHLRNSEVIGFPITYLADKIDITSTSLYKPLMGTHSGLYITLCNNSLVEVVIPELTHVCDIRFISKLYWIMLMKKNIDGIMSVPIEINKLEINN